ncbi:hypothetical protein EMIHUDRAFT_42493, partial [Emiliania huxleyi CCMP1516]|uniref:HECT-type E3 ubiquitin transferase n=2 Tax=Emiliania huxleyi TaxID=2903 RepID=A0A0D3I4X2_EMIH1
PIEVRRGSLLTDAYSELRGLGSGWRLPLRVRFFSAEGGEEAGVGEGIAKEFLVDVLREGFDPSFGLFATGTEGGLYPDPAARMSHAADGASARSWYEFLGAVLAKALWEGILVELPLAPFFLSLLLGRTNTVHDMPAFDAQLARSLRLLRDYDGDVEDLCLSFAVDQYTAEVPPELRRTHSLVPGGASLRVSASNRNQYILHLSHYRRSTQRGGREVILTDSWIRMFSVAELQLVLGGSDAPLNVADWRQHATYSGSLYPAAPRRAVPLSLSRCTCGYHADSPPVRWFWQVLAEYPPPRRAAALKFATSCSRPPLMGFGWLQPPFCIHL